MFTATVAAAQKARPEPSKPGLIDESTPTDEFISWTLERFGKQKMALTTSFGMEGCALIDMIASTGRSLDVVYIDTGFFFKETYGLRDRMIERYPNLHFINRGTSLTPDHQAMIYGPELWRRNPDLCCQLRKTEPLAKALDGVDVWISAIRRSQSPSRSKTRLIEWDFKFDLIKVSPLINWSREQVWNYIQSHDVPFNELHEKGYPSIGCTHCTLPVPGANPATYSRKGRWKGFEKTECGIHEPGATTGQS